MKSIGIEPAELVEIGKKALNEKAKALITKKLMPKVEQAAENNEIAEDIIEQDNKMATGGGGNVPTTKSNKMLPLYLLGGAAVIYLIAKKK